MVARRKAFAKIFLHIRESCSRFAAQLSPSLARYFVMSSDRIAAKVIFREFLCSCC